MFPCFHQSGVKNSHVTVQARVLTVMCSCFPCTDNEIGFELSVKSEPRSPASSTSSSSSSDAGECRPRQQHKQQHQYALPAAASDWARPHGSSGSKSRKPGKGAGHPALRPNPAGQDARARRWTLRRRSLDDAASRSRCSVPREGGGALCSFESETRVV